MTYFSFSDQSVDGFAFSSLVISALRVITCEEGSEVQKAGGKTVARGS